MSISFRTKNVSLETLKDVFPVLHSYTLTICVKQGIIFSVFVCRYAQYGDVSPKVDVFAFGVVLYELISAKEAIVKPNGSIAESMGLVALVNTFPPLFSV